MNTEKSTAGITRRRFLMLTGNTALGVGALLAAPVFLAPITARAASPSEQHFQRTLLRMGRDIYPHDRLDDRYYRQPIAELVEKEQELLAAGVKALDAASEGRHGRPYLDVAAEEDRVALLRSIEETRFFQAVRTALLFGIYDNKALWLPFFGYEGSSWEKGGYINRGFNDLDWL